MIDMFAAPIFVTMVTRNASATQSTINNCDDDFVTVMILTYSRVQFIIIIKIGTSKRV